MKKVFAAVIVFLFCSVLTAQADVYGTTAGTIITAAGISFNYQDGTGIVATANGPANADVTVAHIAGIRQTVAPSDQSSAAGGTRTYIFRYENKGNYSDSILLDKGNVIKSGLAGGTWSAGLWIPSDPSIPDVGDVASQFDVSVASNARDASTGTVTVNVRSAGAALSGWPTGAYVGFNGNTYGGVSAESDQVVTTVVGPMIDIQARTVTSDQPAGYAGSETNPVPGAKLTYTVSVKNNGAGDANGLKLVEHIVGPVDYLLGTMSNNRGGTKEYVIGTTRYADGGSGVTPNVSSLEWTFDLTAGDTATLIYSTGIR